MKNYVLRIMFCCASFPLCAAVSAAQDPPACSLAMVAGSWGYSETGTLYLPTGAVPYASLGSYTVEADGTFSGARTGSVGGTIALAGIKGTLTVNSDCTGTQTFGLYDQSGALTSTVTKSVVYVNNATEARAIVTSLTQANGTVLQTVLITVAKKVSTNSGNQQ